MLIVFLVLAGVSLFWQEVRAALELNWPPSPIPPNIRLTEKTDLPTLIRYLYEWLISLGGLAAFISLIYAGFQYLTSAGDAGKMKEAKSRLTSAFWGLALLLSAVLILNTINPRLTTIKISGGMPTSTPWRIDFNLSFDTIDPCKSAKLYSQIDYQGSLVAELTIPSAPKRDNLNQKTESVTLSGKCNLTLYTKLNYEIDADNPPLIIYDSTKDVSSLGMNTNFKSALLTNAGEEVGSGACNGPACLYDRKNYNTDVERGLEFVANSTWSLGSVTLNNMASSVRVKKNYVAVLYENEDFTGQCLKVDQDIPDLGIGKYNRSGPLGQGTRVGEDDASAVALFNVSPEQIIPMGAVRLCGNDNCQGSWQENITQDVDKFKYDQGASAVQIQPGYAALLFGDREYQGRCSMVAQEPGATGTKTLKLRDLYIEDDQLSSIQVMRIEKLIGGPGMKDFRYPY